AAGSHASPRLRRVPRADDGIRARPCVHGRARREARGAAARFAARHRSGGLGCDRDRADRGLSVRDLRRLERHRPHADGALRRAPPAAEPALAGRPRALPRDLARAVRRDGGRAMSIRVLRPGLLTTIQDHGRHGYQRVGLCPGGAMDPVALSLANALVGNPPEEAALEITVIGPELVFEQDTLVAVCGAEFQGGFPHNRPVLAKAGTRFNVGRAARGARAYIAVAGGFAVDPVLGSRSTFLPGQFGGFEGRALKHGDLLPLRDEKAVERFSVLKKTRDGTVKWSAPPLTLPDREPILVHVIEGQHFASFDSNSQRAFFDTVWRIAPDSNRMGFRRSGPPLGRPQADESPS